MGKDWGQEEKGAAEDELVGWHHQLNELEFEQTPGASGGQRSGWAAVHGVPRSQTQFSDWTSTTTFSDSTLNKQLLEEDRWSYSYLCICHQLALENLVWNLLFVLIWDPWISWSQYLQGMLSSIREGQLFFDWWRETCRLLKLFKVSVSSYAKCGWQYLAFRVWGGLK